jgi:hypothetical protein
MSTGHPADYVYWDRFAGHREQRNPVDKYWVSRRYLFAIHHEYFIPNLPKQIMAREIG